MDERHRDRRAKGGIWARHRRCGIRFDIEVRVGRRRLYLRRRDLAAGKPRRQARRGAREAAAAGAQGPVRPAHRRQQRDLAGHRADHPGEGRRALSRFRHGPVARHPADPARRQHQARRPGREARSASRWANCVDDFGGGTRTGRPIRAVQVGGPLGAYFPASCSIRRSTTRPSPPAAG